MSDTTTKLPKRLDQTEVGFCFNKPIVDASAREMKAAIAHRYNCHDEALAAMKSALNFVKYEHEYDETLKLSSLLTAAIAKMEGKE